ncbi:winged helix-turn-helix domain-containing protein [Luteimonas kalidii]|uniref:Winged helix-turn-helix domain-containing protein n=1 Tax=Luteimonas kalidii TaxID=3042025 RepID=A0ABT6JNY2_9GAMM|nr:winged helix-turn-helix domain-containing protein [Luteimonas kalidii]MDH5832391.1 winged helix-turn-helix domain-containing protein [Luteimonas kalidii]
MPSTPDLPPSGVRFGAFELDLARRELRRDGAPVDMPVRVFECLECLVLHRDRAVGRDELLQAVFHRTDVSDGQLAQVVLRARRCVDDDGHTQHTIGTVPRFGFRWMAATRVLDGGPDAMGRSQYAREDAPVPRGAIQRDPRPDQADGARTPHAAPASTGLPRSGPDDSAVSQADTRIDPGPDDARGALDPGTAPAAKARQMQWARRPRPIAAIVAAVALGLLVASVVAWRLRPTATGAEVAATPVDGAVTLVLPLEIGDGDDIAWARLGLMDYIADRMRTAGLSVPPSESTLSLLGQGEAAPDARALRGKVPAATLVTGRVARAGDGWRLRLEAEGADGVRFEAGAEAVDLLSAAALASDRLLAALGHAAPAGGDGIGLALEERLQRVRAAFLANELDTARRILEDAPPSQLSQPQLRFRLAQVDYRAGRLDAAERAIDTLLADPEAARDPLFRARLLAYRGGARIRRNALHEAERDFDQATAALAGREGDLEHGSVLMGRGVARAALGREDAAIADFGAARTRLQRAGDRLAVARVDANLGALELGRGRPAQALEYLGSALAVFEGSTAMNELQVTRSAMSAAHLSRLDAAAALAVSDQVQALLPRTPDPALRLAAALDRANALIALGRLTEARQVLGSPDIAARSTPPYEHRRAQTRIELAWRSGEPAAAVAIADAILADWTRTPGDALYDHIRLRRAQAARAADVPPVSASSVDTQERPTPALLLAFAVERGEAADAEAGLRAALAAAEARGAPAEIVEVVAVHAPWLLRRGRVSDAAALVGRVAPWLDRCHDCAVLQLQLARALGDDALAAEARRAAERLAGERSLPPVDAALPPAVSGQ